MESIRIALGDEDTSDKQCPSEPEGPGDKSQNKPRGQEHEIRRREAS